MHSCVVRWDPRQSALNMRALHRVASPTPIHRGQFMARARLICRAAQGVLSTPRGQIRQFRAKAVCFRQPETVKLSGRSRTTFVRTSVPHT